MNKKRTVPLTLFPKEPMGTTQQALPKMNVSETCTRNNPETCPKCGRSVQAMPGQLDGLQSGSNRPAAGRKRSKDGVSRSKRQPRRTMPKTRRPTDAELVILANSLGGRDWGILEYLYLIRYATTDQIYRAFFAGHPEAKRRQDCRRRLWELGDSGIVAALPYQQRSRVWFTDKNSGLRLIEDRLKVPKSDRPAPDDWRAGSAHLRHYVAITELYTQVRLSGIPFEWDTGRRRLLWQYYAPDSFDIAPQYIHPDATIRLQVGRVVDGQWTPTGWWTVYFEADMGTEDQSELLYKLDRYQAALRLPLQDIPEPEPMGLAPKTARYVLFVASRARSEWLQDQMDARWLPGLAVPMSEALQTIRRIGELADARLSEMHRRWQEEKRRQEMRQEQEAAWTRYDAEVARWRAAGEQHVSQRRSILKSADRLWEEYRRAHPEPKPPAFPCPARE